MGVAGLLPLATSSSRGALSTSQFIYGKHFISASTGARNVHLFYSRYSSGTVFQIHFWTRNITGSMCEFSMTFKYGQYISINKINIPTSIGTVFSLYYSAENEQFNLYARIPVYLQIVYEVEFTNQTAEIVNQDDSVDLSTLTEIEFL